MCRVLDNSLFVKDRKKYTKISECATSFNSLYNKNNIIQDDIFNVLENYVARHDMPFDMLRYPIEDTDLCACTFIRKGRMFVMINSALPLSKQIFAAAHELYHIYCYFEEHDSALLQFGSILASGIIDEEAKETEDVEANAFAAILLVPKERLLQVTEEEISKQIEITGKVARWQEIPKDFIRFGSLSELMYDVERLDAVRDERLAGDKSRLSEIMESLRKQ